MSGWSHHRSSPEPDFDVKIVGGKRMVIWRAATNQRSENLNKSRSLSAIDNIPDNSHNRTLMLPPIKQIHNDLASNPVFEVNLRRELYSVLKNYEEKRLKYILEDLKKRDLDEQRLTTPKTLTAIAAHHQLPVPPHLLLILCERFANSFIPISVQFENLLNYLINCKSQPPPVSDLNSRSASLPKLPSAQSITKTPQLEPIQKNKEMENLHLPSRHNGQDESLVIHELEKELADDDMRLDLFRRHAYELDSGRRGVLSKQQIENLLASTNITIPESLLLKILAFSDKYGYGLYDITNFLSFFERAKVQSQILFQPNQRRIIRPRTPTIPMGPLPKMHQFTSDVHSVSTPPFTLEPKSLTQEEWLSRYDRMISALRSSQDHKGYIPINEALHIVDNYNIVYNLQLDMSNIQRSVDYSGRNFPGFISIEPFASHLRELHLMQSYWNKF